MKLPQHQYKLRMTPGVYYVWVAGSCDYGHEERCSAGAYFMMKDDDVVEKYVITNDHTTEFRMILSVMLHAMEVLQEHSNIVFLTNVSYIQQNFDKEPTETSANADLINDCRQMKQRHKFVEIKLVPYHKYDQLPETHDIASRAMQEYRNKQ